MIEQNKGKVEELQTKMKEAIEKQDFESAIQIRDEINKLNK
jgi:protein-arginine kinase activator protein McsA